MADAPSPIAASSLPSGFRAAAAMKERDALRAAEAETARRQVRSLAEADDSVETTDADTQIFADAEGTGGQGRAFEETGQPASPEGDSESDGEGDRAGSVAPSGITHDDDGRQHVDLEA